MSCVSTYISACSTEAEREQFTRTVSSTSGLMDSLCQPGEFQDREYGPGHRRARGDALRPSSLGRDSPIQRRP